jgi:hypothetical protein
MNRERVLKKHPQDKKFPLIMRSCCDCSLKVFVPGLRVWAIIRPLIAAVKRFAKNIARLSNHGSVMFYSNTAAPKTGDFGKNASIPR